MLFRDLLQDRVILDNGYQARKPLVSIVTPTYCRMAEGYLERCLLSVQAQTFSDYEHIILDDGSTDGSEALIRQYAQRDSRIVYVRHEHNSGLPALRTDEGILLARGEYVAFAFDDNRWEPAFLERMLESARAHAADVYYSVARISRQKQETAYFSRVPVTLELLSMMNVIANGSVLMRKSFFDTVGLYDPHILVKRVCDWDLWLRALLEGCVFHLVDEVLSEENGMESKVSVGNTTYLDWNIAYQYILDEERLPARRQALLPERVEAYDLLDPHGLIPYARDFYELKMLDPLLYDPYFEKHPKFRQDHPIDDGLFNRASGRKVYPLLNAAYLSRRPRVLLVCNLYSQAVRKIAEHLRKQLPGALVLPCTEQNVLLSAPESIDLVLLVDCCESGVLGASISAWADADIPVGYVTVYGFAKAEPDSRPMDYGSLDSVLDFFQGQRVYFPQANVPMDPSQREHALNLMRRSDFVIDAGEGPLELPPDLEDRVGFDFFRDYSLYDWAIVRRYLKGKRCFVFINSSLYAGSEIFGVILAKMLKNLRLTVELRLPQMDGNLTGGDSNYIIQLAKRSGVESVSATAFTPGPYDRDTNTAKDLAAYLKAQNAGFLVGSSLIADVALAAEILRVPSLFAMFSPANYRPRELGLLKRCLSGVVSDCQRTCDIYNDTLQMDSIRLIDVLEESMFTRPAHPPRERICIASAGTMQPRKQQFEVAEACANLMEAGYPIQLNLYGNNRVFPNYLGQLEQLIQARGLQDRIIIHGFVEDEREITRDNDVIVTASIEEGLPQGMLFNMAAGLVAVGTPVGGLGEVVLDGQTGYLADGFGTAAFEKALRRALDDRERWPRIVDNAQALLRRECDAGKLTNDLLCYMARKMKLSHQVTDWLPVTGLATARTANKPMDESRLRISGRLGARRVYPVTLYQTEVSRIGLIFADLSGRLSGRATLTLYKGRVPLRTDSVDLGPALANRWTNFEFQTLRGYEGRKLKLEIRLENPSEHVIVFEDRKKYTLLCKIRGKLGWPQRKQNLLYLDVQA